MVRNIGLIIVILSIGVSLLYANDNSTVKLNNAAKQIDTAKPSNTAQPSNAAKQTDALQTSPRIELRRSVIQQPENLVAYQQKQPPAPTTPVKTPAPPAQTPAPKATTNGTAKSAKADAQPKPLDAKALAELKAKKSYAYGLDVARAIITDELDFDLESMKQGLADGLRKQKPTITDKEYNELMAMIVTEVKTKSDERLKKIKGENQKATDKFLAENGKKEGIVVMPNGLQYRVLKQGEGKASPTAKNSVRLHMKGSLIDGTEFFSTYTENKPKTFPVTRVLRGLREALLQMKKGDRWMLYIPPELAFGEDGNAPTAVGLPPVGPNQVVIYEVELLDILENVEE